MALSAPKQLTWLISLIVGIIGVVGYLVVIPVVTGLAFWIVVVALVILLLATLLPGV